MSLKIPLGNVVQVNVEDEMQKSYIDYAMSVIVGRALPDVRDGLKPVHRRILYAMYEAGMNPDRPYKKSARVVGDVLARYHPHGDAAVYDAMVRLAQPFNTRYPLIDGQGNFGSIDGDAAAAMRYTEARLSALAMEMLADIEKETVEFVPNYDDTLEEPVVLPARLPNLLVNGSAGIAVGMATNIPPHNLGEVVDALVWLIDNPEADIEELMSIIPGPDFPTGGVIIGLRGVREAYLTGKGVITVRGRIAIEDGPGGRKRIAVTELPYQVNKARLVERIAELVHDHRIEGVTDLRDESDRSGLRVVVELRRDVDPQVVLNRLLKHTQLQETYGIILLALDEGQPRLFDLKGLLVKYLEHRKRVVAARTRFELRKAEERAHIVEGLRIALRYIDKVIQIIRGSKTVDEARDRLMSTLNLTEKQAQAILDMRLQRLTGMEREKVEAEFQELINLIGELRGVLESETRMWAIVREELLAVKKKFSDGRRTSISPEEEVLTEESLIPDDEQVVTITYRGYAKRLPLTTYRNQRRGGRGVTAVPAREDDFLAHLFVAGAHQNILFFTNRGRAFRLKVHEIPEAGRHARGLPLVNLLALASGEQVTAVIPVGEVDRVRYLLMCTRRGIVKKVRLAEFSFNRRDGVAAISLGENDELVGVTLTAGNEDVLIATRSGTLIRFSEQEIRPVGRTARGVRGIRLRPDDWVVGVNACSPEGAEILAVTGDGYGKRTLVDEFRRQTRGGTGTAAVRRGRKGGFLVGLMVVQEGDEIMIVTSDGRLIRTGINEIPVLGRTARGVKLVRLEKRERVLAVTRVAAGEAEKRSRASGNTGGRGSGT